MPVTRTDDVRRAFATDRDDTPRPDWGEAFDRWLAAHDAEIHAAAIGQARAAAAAALEDSQFSTGAYVLGVSDAVHAIDALMRLPAV